MKATRILVCICLLVLGTTLSGQAQEEKASFGLGYHGVVAGDLLQGISGRVWLSPKIGLEGNAYYAHIGVDLTTQDETTGEDVEQNISASFVDLSGKFLYATAIRSQSKFYIGGELGYGHVSADLESDDFPVTLTEGFNIITISPLIGAEFSFSGIPEMSLDWELGYRINMMDIEVSDVDVSVTADALAVAFGIHYYFGR